MTKTVANIKNGKKIKIINDRAEIIKKKKYLRRWRKMENKTCHSCKNFKLFTIKEMEQAFKIYEKIKEINIGKMVFIGRCKFFSKYPSWQKEKYFWQRRNEMGQTDILKIMSRKCVYYKYGRNEREAQMEFDRRWRQARKVLAINSKEPAEINLAELMKMKLPKPVTENFYCEGYGEWVYECPKNYIRLSLSEEVRKPIMGIACYTGVGWCQLSNEEIEEHRKGRKRYMYYGKNTIYNF